MAYEQKIHIRTSPRKDSSLRCGYARWDSDFVSVGPQQEKQATCKRCRSVKKSEKK